MSETGCGRKKYSKRSKRKNAKRSNRRNKAHFMRGAAPPVRWSQVRPRPAVVAEIKGIIEDQIVVLDNAISACKVIMTAQVEEALRNAANSGQFDIDNP